MYCATLQTQCQCPPHYCYLFYRMSSPFKGVEERSFERGRSLKDFHQKGGGRSFESGHSLEQIQYALLHVSWTIFNFNRIHLGMVPS